MAQGWDWQEQRRTGWVGTANSPVDTDPDAALAAALSRHEVALARLRLELPLPSGRMVRELEAAERDLKAILDRRDRAGR